MNLQWQMKKGLRISSGKSDQFINWFWQDACSMKNLQSQLLINNFFLWTCTSKTVLIRGKPNPCRLKIFVAAAPDSLPLDFLVCSGDKILMNMNDEDPQNLDIGGRAVLRLSPPRLYLVYGQILHKSTLLAHHSL